MADLYVTIMNKRDDMSNQSIQFTPCISRFLENNRDLWGARVICVIRTMPDTKIHCIDLSHLLEPPEYISKTSPTNMDSLLKSQATIPRIDDRALREIDKEIKRLTALKIKWISTGKDIKELEIELTKLKAYRLENTQPNGRIRNFNTQSTQTYQRFKKAIKRLMDKALQECPDAYHYLKAHLQTGIYFFWSSVELTVTSQLPQISLKPTKRTRGKAASRIRKSSNQD
jgi:hypothetical protein